MTHVKYWKQKICLKNKYTLDENQLTEAAQKIVSVLKTIRKINACKKEDVCFQVFWPQVHNIWRAGFFRMATFFEYLL